MIFSKFLQKQGLSESQIAVKVFIPYGQTENGLVSEQYDTPLTRRELAEVFAALGLEWQWTPVTKENVVEIVAATAASANGRMPLILNYCDGDGIFDEPGIAVIHELEKYGLTYTGADAHFYHISTSKILMKEAFVRRGVPTAPFVVISDAEQDMRGLCAELGAPLMVKPSVSAGSFGLSLHSVVHNDEELSVQVKNLLQGQYGREFAKGGIFAEKFINGPEFTVLVAGSYDFPENARVYPPVERAFNCELPEEERFFSYDRYWEIYKEESPLPQGARMYEYCLAEPALQKRLAELSWQAYCAVGGTGYGRVDWRMDKETGELLVLEVNANCGISSPEGDSSVSRILNLGGIPFTQLMSDILKGALVRQQVATNGR